MHGLNRLVGKQSHLRVLRALFAAEEPLSGREIERRTGLSNRATMLALDELRTASAVLRSDEGQSFRFVLNRNNFYVMRAIKPALEAENDFWEDLRKTVRRLVLPRPEAAMVTGPLARDEFLSEGVLDLHLLFSGGRERLRAYSCVDRLSREIETRYALSVKPTFMDIRTMDDPEFQVIWRRVAREGILLFGKLP